jgi:hypothetical protein
MSNQHDTQVSVRWNKYEFLGAPRLAGIDFSAKSVAAAWCVATLRGKHWVDRLVGIVNFLFQRV